MTAMRDVVQRRLTNQYLTAPRFNDAAAVIGALSTVQSQDYAGAKWVIAQRSTGLTDADIGAGCRYSASQLGGASQDGTARLLSGLKMERVPEVL